MSRVATQRVTVEQTVQEASLASSPAEDRLSGKRSGRRTALVGILLSLAALAVLAVGGWGLVSSLGAQAPPARIGEAVEVPGGYLRVDAVTPEHMAAMQNGKFAQSGMNMSAAGMDMAPEGYHRFAVQVTFAAGEGGTLDYSPQDFRLTGEGMKEAGPVRSQLQAGSLSSGSAVSGSMVFQAPDDAHDLMLSFDGGRPVALDLPSAGDHSHGGGHDH